MKTSDIKMFLHLSIVLSFIVFVGLSLSFYNTVTLEAFEGAVGGDGNAGPAGDGGGTNVIAGRFFNDKDSDGTWDKNFEELIFSTDNNDEGFGDGVPCNLYTGPKMTVSGIFAVIYGVKYPPNGCTLMEFSVSYTDKGSPAYYTKYISNGDTTITTQLPPGWSCSTVVPGCTRNVTIGVHAYALPIGIKQNPTTCTGPISITNWTDNTIQPNVTKIKKTHIEELRYWINVRRADAGLQPFPWEDPTIIASDQANPTKIRAAHITDLRTAISEVYATCHQTMSSPWTDDPLKSSAESNPTKIKAVHITELRQRTAEAK